VISSSPELPDSLGDSANQISVTAERAATLTRQLLTFSRKQLTQMAQLDLNEVVSNLAKMLQRILGEDIHLNVSFSPVAPAIHADAGMIEQLLMNLAVNARDAMPRGGKLTVQTDTVRIDDGASKTHADAAPGEYVRLSVIDTGEGISAENLPRIFEPFFTTKEVGKGTGLGLATVYGIVKQHRGWITAESEAGAGATFRVFLPLVMKPAPTEPKAAARASMPGGTETILLVEDERPLRAIVRGILERLGYRVLEAQSGLTALEVWRKHRHEVALLFTDLVMPDGMSGRELAESLRKDAPGLRVIYSSGYSAEVVGRSLNLQEGVNFLQKPYRHDKLALAVRQALDSAPVAVEA
jgi:CheY-like chemotaxis protein